MVDGEEEYEGTPGLWELIVSKKPNDTIYTDEDYNNHTKLMIKTNALHRKNNPEINSPRNSRADKWNDILSDI